MKTSCKHWLSLVLGCVTYPDAAAVFRLVHRSGLGKMAEVGQRLGGGVYRLSALRSSQSRPVRTGESPGSLLVTCSFSDGRLTEEPTPDRPEVSRIRGTQRRPEKPCRAVSQQENGALPCAAPLDLDSSRLTGFGHTRESLQAYKTAVYLSAGLQPLLQENLLPGRRTSWTRGAVSIRSPQQLRAFCSAVFILAERGSERPGCGLRPRRLKLHPDTLQAFASSRSYGWRSSKDAPPPLYRSRTAYYDILQVSPGATQSQIKTAYYKQSFIYHPDKNPENKEATQSFSEINEAYTVLGNISLRRKYDHGILSQSDIHSAGRPSSKETTSRSTSSSHHHHHHHQQQQQQQQRARRFSQAGGKTTFDFDAFYQAHYGEQLQREREMRARKERMREMQKENFRRYRMGKMIELTAAMLLAVAGALVFSVSRS